jgi:hypothetical protein
MCRKAHGTPFGTYFFANSDQLRWTSTTDSIVYYRSSPMLIRSFCGHCGSVVPYSGSDSSRVVTPGGCHDHGRPADCNIFTAYNAPWHEITNDLPCYDHYPTASDLLGVEEEPLEPGPEGVVRGSCLCGLVQFHVTKPFKVAHNCYCTRCRRACAAAHASNGFTDFDGVVFIKGKDQLKTYKLPEAQFFTQVFCEICGSKIPRLDPDRNLAVIPLGSLDDDPGIRPMDHIYVAYKCEWHKITDDLPAYEEGPSCQNDDEQTYPGDSFRF